MSGSDRTGSSLKPGGARISWASSAAGAPVTGGFFEKSGSLIERPRPGPPRPPGAAFRAGWPPAAAAPCCRRRPAGGATAGECCARSCAHELTTSTARLMLTTTCTPAPMHGDRQTRHDGNAPRSSAVSSSSPLIGESAQSSLLARRADTCVSVLDGRCGPSASRLAAGTATGRCDRDTSPRCSASESSSDSDSRCGRSPRSTSFECFAL